MPDKVLGTRFETEFGVHVFHRTFVDVEACTSSVQLHAQQAPERLPTLMSRRILFFPVLQVLKEILRPPLFE